MVNTLLYFGSFNPIHNGHTAIARYILESGLSEQLWFVVSPQSPYKEEKDLAPEQDRFKMALIAAEEKLKDLAVHVSDIEFSLPKPSYTIDTIEKLSVEFPDRNFSILIGEDNLSGIKHWKNSETLIENYTFYVYPRAGYESGNDTSNFVYLKDAPRWNFSSTEIRENLNRGDDISHFVSCGVEKYIREHNLWNYTEKLIERLTHEIVTTPRVVELYMQRAKLYYNSALFDKALNDFIKVMTLDPDNKEASAYSKLINDIFAFRHKDYYNP